MRLANGTYRTKAGSTVELSGDYGGISHVSFNWFEEQNACIECHVDPYPHHWGKDENGLEEWRLYWECDECDGGAAVIERVEEHPSED